MIERARNDSTWYDFKNNLTWIWNYPVLWMFGAFKSSPVEVPSLTWPEEISKIIRQNVCPD